VKGVRKENKRLQNVFLRGRRPASAGRRFWNWPLVQAIQSVCRKMKAVVVCPSSRMSARAGVLLADWLQSSRLPPRLQPRRNAATRRRSAGRRERGSRGLAHLHFRVARFAASAAPTGLFRRSTWSLTVVVPG